MRLTNGNKEEHITPIAMHQWHTECVDMMKCKQVLGELRLMEAAVPDTACPSYPTSSPTACLMAALIQQWQEVPGELRFSQCCLPIPTILPTESRAHSSSFCDSKSSTNYPCDVAGSRTWCRAGHGAGYGTSPAEPSFPGGTTAS